MQLEKIITMANLSVKWQLTGMVRSLRATGSNLPVWVIPHDRDPHYFDLPEGCQWWRNHSLHSWLMENGAHPRAGKYQCLLENNFHFVDCDVAFLKNPQEALAAHENFITSCNHWHDYGHTCTPESKRIFHNQSTTWQQWVFNSGQFACDRALYSEKLLKTILKDPEIASTALDGRFHEQAGINLLVLKSGVKIRNLTLPPVCMESTWAGDYEGEDAAPYLQYWADPNRIPYLIHYAGCCLNRTIPINELFFKHFSETERESLQQELNLFIANTLHHRTPKWRRFLSQVKQAFKNTYQFRGSHL
jgi:hypothetical protein